METSSSSSSATNGVIGATGVLQPNPVFQNGVGVLGSSHSQVYMERDAVSETRALVAELCRHFYTLGWVSGTGGSITIKVADDSVPKPRQLVVMSPSGTGAATFIFIL